MRPAFPPHALRDYALLADGERGALIGPDGAISWMCAPTWHDEASQRVMEEITLRAAARGISKALGVLFMFLIERRDSGAILRLYKSFAALMDAPVAAV